MPHRDDEKQFVSYIFGGSVSASSRATFVSNRIGFSFRTKRFQFWANLGTDESVDISCYCAADNEAPTTQILDELNLLAVRGNRTFVRTDDQWIDFYHEIVIDMRGSYLKVHVNNQSALAQEVHVIITIAWLNEIGVKDGES